jgi:ClpP class serine protease
MFIAAVPNLLKRTGVARPIAGGINHRADDVPEWAKSWALGVSSKVYGDAVVVRIDGGVGFGAESSWAFGARTEAIVAEINAATTAARMGVADGTRAKPRMLILDINSPGGMVAGLSAVVGALNAARAAGIQTEAIVRDLAASMGCIMAMLCGRVVATPSAIVGGLGVMFVVEDYTAAYEKAGVATTVITSNGAEAKAWGVPGTSVSQEMVGELTEIANEHANLAIAEVAKARGVDAGMVAALFDGKLATAGKGARLGIVDAVVDPEAYFAALGAGADRAGAEIEVEESEDDGLDDALDGMEPQTNEGEQPMSKGNSSVANAIKVLASMVVGKGGGEGKEGGPGGPPHQDAVAAGVAGGDARPTNSNTNVVNFAAVKAAMAAAGVYEAEAAAALVEKNLTAEGLASEVAALTVAKLAEANTKIAEAQTQLAASQAKVAELEAEAAKRKSTIESAMAGKVVPKVAPVAVGAREQGAETGAGAAFEAKVAAHANKNGLNIFVARVEMAKLDPVGYKTWRDEQKLLEVGA